MKVYNNILETIGKTPIVKINKLNDGVANIFAKVEFFNPAGSIKDRAALAMIEQAEQEGIISPNKTTIIEPTSGNTGIGLALVCLIKGYKLILTMPESMSKERRDILSIYGAQLVLTPAQDGMKGSIDKANELLNEISNSYMPQQFSNPINVLSHYFSTGEEIYKDMDKKVDIFVATVGTGGTISGCAKYLKEKNSKIKVVAVEPLTSPMITKGESAPHKIQGIGANFVPDNYYPELVDEVICIDDNDAIQYAKKLANTEGIFCGISSGAAIKAAIELSKRDENIGKNIVVILPDTGMRYLSSEMFQ
ncbi:MAG: cysteine synthase A [Candidatus Gastranaerophilales bacterium]|nr:cysteine synthase A [Candidatus Gastranaerophilales bacterium]